MVAEGLRRFVDTKRVVLSISSNSGVAVAIALITLSGFLFPIALTEITGSHQVIFEGTPIADTVFSEVVSEKPDAAMLPGGEVNRTQDKLYMRADYSPLVTVNLADAIERASNFMSGIAHLANKTIDLFNSEYVQASWRLSFNVRNSSHYAHIWVNAISGKIAGFDTDWTSEAPSPDQRDVDTVNYLNMSAVEASALQFFKSRNYTLSPYTMVLPPVPYPNPVDLGGGHFYLRFCCVMNDTLMDGNEISLFLDMVTGEVFAFYYSWTYFRQIPTAGMVSAHSAEHAVLAYAYGKRDHTCVRVTSSALVLQNWGLGAANASDFKLFWEVKGLVLYRNHPFSALIYPLSGEVRRFIVPPTLASMPSVEYPKVSPVFVALPLCFSLTIAAISWILVRKRISVVNITLEQET